MKQVLNQAGRPKPLRRTAARSFSLATKQWRFQEVEGRCEACGELIGDGTDWRRAIYHHIRLVSDPNVSDKEARAAANCMVLLFAARGALRIWPVFVLGHRFSGLAAIQRYPRNTGRRGHRPAFTWR
jgi:hypothetical protein